MAEVGGEGPEGLKKIYESLSMFPGEQSHQNRAYYGRWLIILSWTFFLAGWWLVVILSFYYFLLIRDDHSETFF
jgi:hypothetical protein